MDNQKLLPERFSAETATDEGVVKIIDQVTSQSIQVPLHSFDSVAAALNAFASDAPTAQPTAKGKKPAAKAKAEKPAPAPSPEPKAAEKKKSAAPKKAAAPKAAPKKPAAAKKAAPAPAAKKTQSTKPSGSEYPERIEDNGFHLERQDEDGAVTYSVFKDTGEYFAKLAREANGKFKLTPAQSDGFKPSQHASIMAAQARIDILID